LEPDAFCEVLRASSAAPDVPPVVSASMAAPVTDTEVARSA
jgi:hypothetical protein